MAPIGGGGDAKAPKAAPKVRPDITMEDPSVRNAEAAEILRLNRRRGRQGTLLAGAAPGAGGGGKLLLGAE